MQAEITVSEIYQTSTTTKPNQFKMTLVATGNREAIKAYAKSVSMLPINQVDITVADNEDN